MLNQLKNFEVDRLDLEELVALSAFGRKLAAEFELLNVESPEWLDQRTRELRREIRTRVQDRIEKRLREHKARLESLKPAEEKRGEISAEIARLEALLEK